MDENGQRQPEPGFERPQPPFTADKADKIWIRDRHARLWIRASARFDTRPIEPELVKLVRGQDVDFRLFALLDVATRYHRLVGHDLSLFFRYDARQRKGRAERGWFCRAEGKGLGSRVYESAPGTLSYAVESWRQMKKDIVEMRPSLSLSTRS